MRTKRFSALAAGSLLLAATGAFTASTAEAATPTASSVSPAYTDGCLTGRVVSTAANLPIKSSPTLTAGTITTAQVGDQFNCLTYTTGDRYTACGHSNANGWLVIYFNSGQRGYSYETCWDDVF
ncbi:hypothetical protein ACWERV_00850 [Streptomyces sp. NPDC004031]